MNGYGFIITCDDTLVMIHLLLYFASNVFAESESILKVCTLSVSQVKIYLFYFIFVNG